MSKRRSRSSLPEIMDYYIQIDDWTPKMGLGIDRSRVWDRPYWEQYGVIILGRMLAPRVVRKFEVRGVGVEVTISGSRSISRIITQAEEGWDDRKPHGVGVVQGLKRTGVPWALLSAPMEQVPIIVTLLCHERVRYLRLRGDALLRGSANIHSWDLVGGLYPDDDPGISPITGAHGGNLLPAADDPS